MRTLIVDDDKAESRRLEIGLRRHGFLCDFGGLTTDARDMVATIAYAAIIIAPMSHDTDGLGFLRELRQRRSDTPVIVLGVSAAPRHSIAALDAGADDHLCKPVDPDELAARLRAVLRRGRTIADGIKFGDLAYDPTTLELSVRGFPVVLSARERQLLELLMRAGGRVVTRSYAEDQLFGHSVSLGSNAIQVYVHRLRSRLLEVGSSARIESVRAMGYLLRVDDPADRAKGRE